MEASSRRRALDSCPAPVGLEYREVGNRRELGRTVRGRGRGALDFVQGAEEQVVPPSPSMGLQAWPCMAARRLVASRRPWCYLGRGAGDLGYPGTAVVAAMFLRLPTNLVFFREAKMRREQRMPEIASSITEATAARRRNEFFPVSVFPQLSMS